MTETTCPHCRFVKRMQHIRGHDVKAHQACRNGTCFHVSGHHVPGYDKRVRHHSGATDEKFYAPQGHITYQGRHWHVSQAPSTRRRIVLGRAKTHGYKKVVEELVALSNVSTDRRVIRAAYGDYRWLRAVHERGRVE